MINVNNLIKKSRNKVIINDFSFTFLPNNVYQITGMNGEGKSTLLKCLSGIIEIDSGTITYDNFLIKGEYKSMIRSDFVCYIDQSIDLISQLSVRENLLLESKLLGYKIDMSDFNRLIENFNLKNRLDTKIKNLSGGQKKAVSFIKGLLSEKPIVIYDEILASMDRKHKDIAINLIKENQKKKVIIISTNESIEVGIIVNLNEKNENIVLPIKDYPKTTLLHKPILKHILLTKSFLMMILLFASFISVALLSSSIHFYNQGQNIYQSYSAESNSYLLIDNDKMNKVSLKELNKYAIYSLYDSDILINDNMTDTTISFTTKNDRNEVNINSQFADRYNLQENDMIMFNNENFIVKEIYELINTMIEPKIFFSDQYSISGVIIKDKFSVYQPDESEFKFIYGKGIVSGLEFRGNDYITASINMLEFYKNVTYIICLFFGISTIAVGYLFMKNSNSSICRFLYVISNIGLNKKSINHYQRRQQTFIFVVSFIFGFIGFIFLVNILNNNFISQDNVAVNIIRMSFSSIIIPAVVWFIAYYLTTRIKVKVTDLY